MRSRTGTVLGLTAVVWLLVGCTPWANYPPIEGAAAINNPNVPPIPILMAEAVEWMHENYGAEGDEIVLNLPPNTPATVYDRVIVRLKEGRPMTFGDGRAYHVTNVRVRTVQAEVDVIAPRADGVHESTTLYFKNHLAKGWLVERLVDRLRQANA